MIFLLCKSDIVRSAHSDIIFALLRPAREAHITAEGNITHEVHRTRRKANITEKSTSALQMYFFLAGVVGFEPTDDGVRVRSLTAWRHPNIFS